MYLPLLAVASTVSEYPVIRYLAWCIVEGDALNDWLTHIDDVPGLWYVIGETLAMIFHAAG